MASDDGKTRDLDADDKALLLMLAANVRRLRDEQGLTREKLAWSVSVSKPYITRIEAAERAPSLPVLRRLAVGLGVEPWELLRPADS